MARSNLRAINFFARPRRRWLRVQRAHLLILLLIRIGIHSCRHAVPSRSSAADRHRRLPWRWRSTPRPRRPRFKVILDTLRVRAAITLQLRFDPIHRLTVPVRPLPPVPKLSQPLNRRLIPLQNQPPHQPRDRLRSRSLVSLVLSRRLIRGVSRRRAHLRRCRGVSRRRVGCRPLRPPRSTHHNPKHSYRRNRQFPSHFHSPPIPLVHTVSTAIPDLPSRIFQAANSKAPLIVPLFTQARPSSCTGAARWASIADESRLSGGSSD